MTFAAVHQRKSLAVDSNDELEALTSADLVEGDLVYVTGTAQYWQLRKTSTAATGSSVLTSASGGRWFLVDLLAGGIVSLADIAELQAYDDTLLVIGSEVFVRSVRSKFTLTDVDPGVADNITNVDGLSGTKWWYRTPMPELWDEQLKFYINATTGDDENSGADGFPIASIAELERRTFANASPRRVVVPNRVALEIYAETDLDATTLQVSSPSTTMQGVLATIIENVAISVATPLVRMNPGYTAESINTGAAIDWTDMANVGAQLILRDNLGAVKAKGFVTRMLTAQSVNTRFFNDAGSRVTPLNTDTVSLYTMPVVTITYLTCTNRGYIDFYDVSLQAAVTGADFYLQDSVFAGDIFRSSGLMFRCGLGRTNVTSLDTYTPETGAGVIFDACSFRVFGGGSGALWVFHGATVLLKHDCGFCGVDDFLDNGITIDEGGQVTVEDNLEFNRCQAEAAIIVGRHAQIGYELTPNAGAAFGGSGYVYGATGTTVSVNASGSQAYYKDKACFAATAATVDWSHADGTGTGASVTGAAAALPAATKLSVALVGIVPYN